MNLKATPIQSQAKRIHSVTKRSDSQVFKKDFDVSLDYAVAAIHQVRESSRSVFDALLTCAFSCKRVFPSHRTIAKKTGYSIRTVQRSVKELKEAGILETDYYYFESLVYYIPEIFNQKFPQQQLKRLLNSYKIFGLLFLLSKPALEASVTVDKVNGTVSNNIVVIRESYKHAHEGTDYQFKPKVSTEYRERRDKKRMTTKDRVTLIGNISKPMGLTSHGIAKLCAYNSRAVEYGWKQWSIALKQIDPWAYFMGVCEKFSTTNSLKVDWEFYLTLRDNYQCKESDPYLDPVKLEEQRRSIKRDENEQYSNGEAREVFVQKPKPSSFSKPAFQITTPKPQAPKVAPAPRGPAEIQAEMRDWLEKIELADTTNNDILKMCAENILRNLANEMKHITGE